MCEAKYSVVHTYAILIVEMKSYCYGDTTSLTLYLNPEPPKNNLLDKFHKGKIHCMRIKGIVYFHSLYFSLPPCISYAREGCLFWSIVRVKYDSTRVKTYYDCTKEPNNHGKFLFDMILIYLLIYELCSDYTSILKIMNLKMK